MKHSQKIERILNLLPDDWQSFTPARFAAWVEEFDSIRVQFETLPLPSGFFGCSFFIVEPDEIPEGIIVVAQDLTPPHRAHVQLHELAHLALGHRTWSGTEAELMAEWSNPAGMQRLLNRFTCRAPVHSIEEERRRIEEQEAELLTRLIAQRVFHTQQGSMLQRGSSQAELEEAMQQMGIAAQWRG